MAYKRPESILIVVAAQTGEVLLLRRREPADFWQSVTGSLRADETPLAAARRELREETGLAADAGLEDTGQVNRYPIHPAWRARYAPDVVENTEYVFRLLLPAVAPVTLAPDEHTEAVWLPKAKAAALASSATNRAAILALVPEPLAE